MAPSAALRRNPSGMRLLQYTADNFNHLLTGEAVFLDLEQQLRRLY
jgi:hypothetical protein